MQLRWLEIRTLNSCGLELSSKRNDPFGFVRWNAMADAHPAGPPPTMITSKRKQGSVYTSPEIMHMIQTVVYTFCYCIHEDFVSLREIKAQAVEGVWKNHKKQENITHLPIVKALQGIQSQHDQWTRQNPGSLEILKKWHRWVGTCHGGGVQILRWSELRSSSYE